MSALLEFEDVSKSFPLWWKRERLVAWVTAAARRRKREVKRVVELLSFSLHEGEIVGILGPNGSGKSTILRLAAGIYEADKGRVTISAPVLPFMSPAAYFSPELSVKENVAMCRALMRVSEPIEQLSESVIRQAAIDVAPDTQARLLSPGMRARLAFSILEHSAARVLLLDEFERSLDQAARRHCCERIKAFAKRGGACLIASHDVDIVRKICTKLLVYRKSEFKLYSSIEEAFDSFKDEV